ncbi:MAG TPA: hypothetical protein IGR64_00725 [Leptolyngbyaceae cyanobacterium M65_K2018_010]|nr:hypothetical protein [Leptolyngbyaceae cyanobacterium M65_K2018_010]
MSNHVSNHFLLIPPSALAKGLGTLTLALVSTVMTLSPSLADMGHSQPSQGSTPAPDSTPVPHGAHGHSRLEIPAGQPVPTITLIAYPDPVRGWNLEIQTTDFRFAPEHVNQANQPNEGHGHLYLNGHYVSRVYGPWLHLPSLPSGRNEIRVTLNSNSHQALTHNGEEIMATVMVEAP